MKGDKEFCEFCSMEITNPICVNCYLRHVRAWLQDFGVSASEQKKAVEKIEQRLPKEALNKHTCISCKKESVGVCSYCAFLKSADVITSLATDDQKETFLDSSNFEIEWHMK